MPEQDLTATEQIVNETDAGQGPPSLLGKLKVLGFVVVVVLVECAMAYMLLPDAAETAALARGSLAGGGGDGTSAAGEGVPAEAIPSDQREVDLGEFSVTAYHPTSDATLRIDFHLYGTIANDNEVEDEFMELVEGNRHRFRDQVLSTIRSAEMTDLTDPTLGLVKRKILEKINRTLGRPLLRAVIFSDFSFIEQ